MKTYDRFGSFNNAKRFSFQGVNSKKPALPSACQPYLLPLHRSFVYNEKKRADHQKVEWLWRLSSRKWACQDQLELWQDISSILHWLSNVSGDVKPSGRDSGRTTQLTYTADVTQLCSSSSSGSVRRSGSSSTRRNTYRYEPESQPLLMLSWTSACVVAVVSALSEKLSFIESEVCVLSWRMSARSASQIVRRLYKWNRLIWAEV